MIETEEVELLRQRLEATEARLVRAEETIKKIAGAIIDTDFKTFHCMKQLLTANDVFRDSIGHDPMRVNILEILNDLRRFTKKRFEVAGIIAVAQSEPNGEEPDASHGDGDRPNSLHRGRNIKV